MDHHRLMLQGASIVRFANTFLDAYKKEKDFIFVAIYISNTGMMDRYVLYQNKGSKKVCRTKQSFDITVKDDCNKFARELYNLSSALHDESENEDTDGNVKKLAASANKLRQEHNLPTFTSKTEHPASDDEGSETGSSRQEDDESDDGLQ